MATSSDNIDNVGDANAPGLELDSELEALNEEEDEDMVSQVNQFFAELSNDEGRKRKRLIDTGSGLSRRKSILPSHLCQVMGSANLRLATGDRSGAIELCMEIIRQAPHASEPYLTLATVYEDLGFDEKLLGILMIASHLKRSDCDMWVKTGNLAIKLNDYKIAIHCITKATRLSPDNVSLLWQKATLHSELKEPRKALDTLNTLSGLLVTSNPTHYVEVIKEMARIHHMLTETHKAIFILSNLLTTHSSLVDEEVVNLLAELCVINKAYRQAYEVITEHYDMVTVLSESSAEVLTGTTPSGDPELLSLTTALRMSIAGEEMDSSTPDTTAPGTPPPTNEIFHVPDELPVDLRVKLAVCMIHLGKELPDEVLQPLFNNPNGPEEYGDLFLDVTDALTECGEYAKALPLLTMLVSTKKYSQAGVYLKLAECQHELSDWEAAAMAYSKVISLAPNHTESRLKLATLYVQLGQTDDALQLLETEQEPEQQAADKQLTTSKSSGVTLYDPHSDVESREDIRVVLHRYNLYLNKGDVSGYCKAGKTLLAFLFREFYYRHEVKEMILFKRLKVKLGADAEKGRTKPETKREERETEALLSIKEWYQTFVETCKGLYKQGPSEHPAIVHLIYCACLSKKFSSIPTLNKKFMLFCVSVCILINDNGSAFLMLKLLANTCVDYKHTWSILNTLPLDTKVYKYILRLCFKNQTNPYLTRILSAHNHACGNYKFALSQYLTNFNDKSSEDRYALSMCIAVVFINMSCQARTNVSIKNYCITQAAAYLHTYVKLRGDCQEVNYNLGRAFHQLGISHMACHYYKKVLSLEPECQQPDWTEASDLRAEAGFNLSLIYRASGNQQLAINILRKYTTI